MFESSGNFLDFKANRTNDITFKGEPELIIGNNILTEIDVLAEVKSLSDMVTKNAEYFIEDLKNIVNGKKFISNLNVKCKDCQFRGITLNGFNECWIEYPRPEHHIFELYNGTRIIENGNSYFNELIQEKRISLFDISLDKLTTSWGVRQKIQIENTKENRSWCSDNLKNYISQETQYPIAFIDFETARLKIPAYNNMMPNEILAFQWSCHIIENKESAPIHKQFLCNSDEFPNFIFAEKLFELLENSKTIFMWATHEKSVIREIKTQFEKRGIENEKLKALLEKYSQENAFVDMCKLTLQYYFHPDMRKSTSLKDVLPSIWQNYSTINKDKWFQEYFKEHEGIILNPYDTLDKVEIMEQSESIKEGTAAIIGYQKYLIALKNGEKEVAHKWATLLLQYCKLDTMAMVIVWKHWLNLHEIKSEFIPVKN